MNKFEKEVLKLIPKTETTKNSWFLICKNCGYLTTQDEELRFIEFMGSGGVCYCATEDRIFYPFYKIGKKTGTLLSLLKPKDRVKVIKTKNMRVWE